MLDALIERATMRLSHVAFLISAKFDQLGAILKMSAANHRTGRMKDTPQGRTLIAFWRIQRRTDWRVFSLIQQNRDKEEQIRQQVLDDILIGAGRMDSNAPEAPNVPYHPNDGPPRSSEDDHA